MSIREQPGYDLTHWKDVLTGVLEMDEEEARLTILFRNGLIDAVNLCEELYEQAEGDGKRLLVDVGDYLCCVIEGDA